MNHLSVGVALVVLGCAGAVQAQEQTASIEGVVRDASGGVVPGVSVTASNASGRTVPAVTDGAGRYRFPSLPPGRFEIEAQLTGFVPVRVENVDLRLGQQLVIPVTLFRLRRCHLPAGSWPPPSGTARVRRPSASGTSRPRSLRVLDLPPSAWSAKNADGSAMSETGYEQGVHSMHFLDETTLYTAGDGGLRRWDLETGSHETVIEPEPGGRLGVSAMKMAADTGARVALVRALEAPGSATLLVDLETGAARPIPEAGHEDRMFLAGAGTVLALGGTTTGVVRVGRISGGPLHLLVGHDQPATHVAVSPDLKWVVSASQDHTLRLWPMPDLDEPPLHTLPRDQLLAKLKSLTNLRAVRDPESPTGWTIDVGPFPGWKEVPEW